MAVTHRSQSRDLPLRDDFFGGIANILFGSHVIKAENLRLAHPSKHMTRYETAFGKKLGDRTGPSVGVSDSFGTTT
jgi:hypothetical protein